ncbi:BTAD domain-containing putative transcriptional regulator [Micromonospora sp. WMMD1128]|uniref:AfsR/SARP family transcriptional regulator n=1 Tax=Micromonospora sp. WMMD1128 TaxID=3015150 RepID=UPI00248B338F|nr:BTAD domain-containing putative transcriptional regulator [Micromonospora sp. WMMD1128]WBB71520.1 BTAD domain-containing putative transcriptional regulator [Micromonospora sp. WMMD1128]
MESHVASLPARRDPALVAPTPTAAFRVLGPLTLTTGADALVLPPSKVTCLLAALLLHPDEVVSVATLQQAIWGDDPPVSARAALQTCALRLRQLFQRHGLTANVIRTVPGGYRITAGPQTVDLMRFRELAGRTRAEPEPETELATLEEALALWREPMLANVPSEALHRDVVPRVGEERVRVIERLCDLKIGLGRDRSVLVDLWAATRVYPANERFAAKLVEVLYRTGRQADALTELRRIKEHLGNELGVGPGAGLRRLELAILRGEAPTPVVTTTSRPAPPTPVRPPAAGFVGRAALCRTLADRLRGGTRIVVLSGLPGVGKTALAQHVAGLVADDFPGGVWPVEPDATDASSPPTPAGRRLLLADDVADATLARRLPALLSPGDVLLLTSRPSLSALVARLGGWLHRVEPLDRDEALDLLGVALGPDRVRAEPRAAADLAALCEHLPLALRIAATRVLLRARMTLDEAAEWLRADPIGRLSLPGDPEMSLAGRLDGALARLGDALADAFLRLAAGAPETITVPGAAGLLGVDPARARELLDDLVDQSLMEEAADQYRIRDLLRRHALGVAGRRPTPDRVKGTLG